MMSRQVSRRLRMRGRNAEKFEARIVTRRDGAAVEIQLADLPHDADLPDRSRAYQDVVLSIFNGRLGSHRKSGIAPLPPQEDVRIEKQSHGSGINAKSLAQILGQRRVEVG